MSGAIMPEPFAIPLIFTDFPSTLMVSPAPFEKVSVVIIAAAAAAKLSSRKEFFKTGIAFISLSTGSGSPITPVDDVRMLLSGKPSESDKAVTSFLTDRSPTLPVKALAFPEFTRKAKPLSD